MAHQREFSSPNEQFAIPEENYWAQDNVATSDPQLVYKSGHSFYGDAGLFFLNPATLNAMMPAFLALFGILILFQFLTSIGTSIRFINNLLFSNVQTARSLMTDPKMLELTKFVLASVERFAKQNEENKKSEEQKQ